MLRNGHAIILFVMTILFGCSGGGSDDGGYSQQPPPAQTPTWDEVAVIIQADCAGCHDGTKEPLLTPSATFKASPAAAKLKSGEMPKEPKTISDADKAKLLAYLGS